MSEQIIGVESLKLFIKEIYIENFKCFQGEFKLELKEGLNILVGDNEAGKSTILEAIYLALTGIFNGRYVRNELSQYLFNNKVVEAYLEDLKKNGVNASLPRVLIEVFIEGGGAPTLEGKGNRKKDDKAQGFSFEIAFNEKFQPEYETLVNSGDIQTLPIEYYDIQWKSFARDTTITPRMIPLKAAPIDSSSYRYRSGSDIYISQIIREVLEMEDLVAVSQAHRKLKENFMDDESIKGINKKIETAAEISDRDVKISVDLSSKNAWETSLMTYLDDVPFQHIGKGEQTTIKTKLALAHRKTSQANMLLIEEPENHLSHSRLNKLINHLEKRMKEKQIIVATHSSYVANKLGLNNLFLLHDQKSTAFDKVEEDTKDFFTKLAGYDTLRLLLCRKAILVEGDSDELAVQKAYLQAKGNLPISDEIDVISVGTAFLRFLEIAKQIKKPVAVVTDNDGDVEALKLKYNAYLGKASETKEFIRIIYDEIVDTGDDINGKPFNYNTLEPKMLKVNGRDELNKIFEKKYKTDIELLKYMKNNKTACALKIFEFEKEIKFPDYILEAIKDE